MTCNRHKYAVNYLHSVCVCVIITPALLCKLKPIDLSRG